MVAPGEVEILRALERRDMIGPGIYVADKKSPVGISFTELIKETGLSRSVLSDYLKNLQKLGFIQRNIDTRQYFLTEENGKIAIEILNIIDTLNRILISQNARPLFSYKSSIDKISEEVKDIMSKLIAEAIHHDRSNKFPSG